MTMLLSFLAIFTIAFFPSSWPVLLITRVRYPSVPAFRCSVSTETRENWSTGLIFTGRERVWFTSRYMYWILSVPICSAIQR